MSRRYPILLALVALLALLVTGQQVAAAATPDVQVVGTAPIPSSAPSTDQVSYLISVANGPIEDSVLHAVQPTSLPANPASVQVDGAAAPAGTVDSAGAGLTIHLGTGADATHGGEVASGSHVVTFQISVPAVPTGATSISARLDYTSGGANHEVVSPSIPLTQPDLKLTTPLGSGEDQVLPLGTGEDGDFAAILTNSGADASAATVTVTLPAGLEVDQSFGIYRDDDYQKFYDNGGVRLACTTPAPSVVKCALGAVPNGINTLIDVPVQATPSARVGAIGTFTVGALADSGQDANPSDNVVSGSVRFVGAAALSVTLNPTKATVDVGKKVAITATITNAGPNSAPETIGLLGLTTGHFTIVHFSGRQLPSPLLPGGGLGGLGSSGSSGSSGNSGGSSSLAQQHARMHVASAGVTSNDTPIVVWNVGTVAPGAKVTSVLTVKAVSVGKDMVAAAALSVAGNPACDLLQPGSACHDFAEARLTAVRAAAHKASGPPSQSPSSSGPELADTGPAHVGDLTAAGVLAIALGAVLLALGTRRFGRRQGARHR